jgi:hypothetical protein
MENGKVEVWFIWFSITFWGVGIGMACLASIDTHTNILYWIGAEYLFGGLLVYLIGPDAFHKWYKAILFIILWYPALWIENLKDWLTD